MATDDTASAEPRLRLVTDVEGVLYLVVPAAQWERLGRPSSVPISVLAIEP